MIWKPGILNCDAVIKYTNGRIKYTDSNICDRCDKGLQDKTNQIRSLNMVPIREIDAKLPAINTEQPFNQHGTAFGPLRTTSPSRSANDMPASVVATTGAIVKPPNLPETTGMEELEQKTKTVAVQNPEYQDTRNLSLTPQTNRKSPLSHAVRLSGR